MIPSTVSALRIFLEMQYLFQNSLYRFLYLSQFFVTRRSWHYPNFSCIDCWSVRSRSIKSQKKMICCCETIFNHSGIFLNPICLGRGVWLVLHFYNLNKIEVVRLNLTYPKIYQGQFGCVNECLDTSWYFPIFEICMLGRIFKDNKHNSLNLIVKISLVIYLQTLSVPWSSKSFLSFTLGKLKC